MTRRQASGTRRITQPAAAQGAQQTASFDARLLNMPSDGPMLLSVTEAARRIGIGKSVLYPYVMDGTLPSVVLGGAEKKVLASAIPVFLVTLWERQRVELAS